MRTTPCIPLALCLVAAVGCQSTSTPVQPAPAPIMKAVPAPIVKAVPAPIVKETPVVSAVGKNVRAVIAEAGTRRLEFFTLDDKPLESLPEKAAGSVSIHAAEGAGQDNYRFDETGKITRHLRSYGGNYSAGVWEPVP